MMAKNIPNIVGNRYGRWTVIGNADKCQSGEKENFMPVRLRNGKSATAFLCNIW